MSFFFELPSEVLIKIAQQARTKRLEKNLTQQNLSSYSGVSLAVIKKFEKSGKISLESLLKIALVLDTLEDFSKLFALSDTPQSLFINKPKKKRQRARKTL